MTAPTMSGMLFSLSHSMKRKGLSTVLAMVSPAEYVVICAVVATAASVPSVFTFIKTFCRMLVTDSVVGPVAIPLSSALSETIKEYMQHGIWNMAVCDNLEKSGVCTASCFLKKGHFLADLTLRLSH